MNVVLISRTQSKLDETAKLLQQRYKVKTVTVAADFANADANTWSTIDSAIKNLPIGVLVNNVGLSYDHAEYFDLVDEQLVKDLIQINITATTKVCSRLKTGFPHAGFVQPLWVAPQGFGSYTQIAWHIHDSGSGE